MKIPSIGLPVAYLAPFVAIAAVVGLPVVALVRGLARRTAIASLFGLFTGLLLAMTFARAVL